MYLPTEIHNLILEYLPDENLGDYRLICRSFSIHGLDRLFAKPTFITTLPSLKKLANIASHEHLGRHVRILWWRSDVNEFETRSFFEGLRIRELRYLLHQPSTCTAQAMSAQEDANDTKVRLSRSIGVFVLHSIFSGFPNLSRVDVYKDKHGSTRNAFNSRYKMQTAVLAANLAGCKTFELTARLLWERIGLSEEFWPNIANAIEPLQSIAFDISAPWAWDRYPVDNIPSYGSEDDFITTNRSLSSIKSFLSKAKNLELLSVHFDGRGLSVATTLPPYAYLESILPFDQTGLPTYPYLRYLSLRNLITQRSILLGFLSAHSATLKTLKMCDMVLDPPDNWLHILPDIRRTLSLEDAFLRENFSNGVNRSDHYWWFSSFTSKYMGDYLTGKTDICPIK